MISGFNPEEGICWDFRNPSENSSYDKTSIHQKTAAWPVSMVAAVRFYACSCIVRYKKQSRE